MSKNEKRAKNDEEERYEVASQNVFPPSLYLSFFLSFCLSVCGFLAQPQGPLKTPLLSDPITISASSTVNRLMNTNVNQPAGPVSKWKLAYGDFSIPKWRPFIFKGPDSWRNQ